MLLTDLVNNLRVQLLLFWEGFYVLFWYPLHIQSPNRNVCGSKVASIGATQASPT